MRKLILTGIISVLITIAWISHLKYDTIKFIKEVSLETSDLKQEFNNPKKNGRMNSIEDVDETQQTGNNNLTKSSLGEVTEHEINSPKTDMSMRGKGGTLDTNNTASNTGISPVLKKVFTQIHPFYQQIQEVQLELVPLIDISLEISKREQDIGRELAVTTNLEKIRELNIEYQALFKLDAEMGPRIRELQDESKRLGDKVERILSEYGFPSGNDFFKSHQETYNTWISEQ